MLIDTHTHLYLEEFDCDGGGTAAVDRALAAGIGHMILPNVDLSTIEPMMALHEARPEVTSIAMGLHPTEVTDNWREDLDRVRQWLGDGSGFVAVGEIGIDLYWDQSRKREQMQAFEQQLQWAEQLDLPVIIHCREGLNETMEVLESFPGLKGVMHSFGGTTDDVEAVRRKVDFHFGVNGIVTFKNSRVRDVLPAIGLDRLLLETDSPYLAPVPYRGKRNESAYMVKTAEHIAQHLNKTTEAIAVATASNAESLFGLAI
ncbi:MAG: TatD family hydrolase [Bacteroides sp.]|nr:TatD family hydrolase [Bacteroides sp.]MCM1412864.1 TatD family hydrolase [Bacteroides sp.]MCM1471533.1 TatD family hydrolase [Bacteroides sp.]